MSRYKCVKCGKVEEKEGYRSNVCSDCITPKPFGVPYLRETVFVRHYGNESKALVNECYRRIIVPEKDGNGGNAVGRIAENGKIQDRDPVMEGG